MNQTVQNTFTFRQPYRRRVVKDQRKNSKQMQGWSFASLCSKKKSFFKISETKENLVAWCNDDDDVIVEVGLVKPTVPYFQINLGTRCFHRVIEIRGKIWENCSSYPKLSRALYFVIDKITFNFTQLDKLSSYSG